MISLFGIKQKIMLYPSKCKAFSVTHELNILHSLPFTILSYKLGSDYIDYASSQLDLGVTIAGKLLWTNHRDILLAKAISKLG